MCKRAYRAVLIELSGKHTGTFKIIYGLPEAFTILARKQKLCLSLTRHSVLGRLVYIAVSMARYGNRLFPATHHGLYAVDKYRCAEYRTVKIRSDSAVRAFPHFRKSVFFNPLLIRRYCGAFYGDAVFFCCLCGFKRHSVVRSFPLR